MYKYKLKYKSFPEPYVHLSMHTALHPYIYCPPLTSWTGAGTALHKNMRTNTFFFSKYFRAVSLRYYKFKLIYMYIFFYLFILSFVYLFYLYYRYSVNLYLSNIGQSQVLLISKYIFT